MALAQKIGIAPTAAPLGLHESQLYDWRSQVRQGEKRSAEEQRLATENARLRGELAEKAEELAILKKAATDFAKHPK